MLASTVFFPLIHPPALVSSLEFLRLSRPCKVSVCTCSCESQRHYQVEIRNGRAKNQFNSGVTILAKFALAIGDTTAVRFWLECVGGCGCPSEPS